jgi:hypothetical protein
MALNVPNPSSARLAPVEPRHAAAFSFALLTASCALASLALACATPFAAFAHGWSIRRSDSVRFIIPSTAARCSGVL